MFIKVFQLFNYKSYINSKKLELSPGINILIGQNNSGKTALLEALSLRLSSNYHRSTKTLTTPFSKIDKNSTARIRLIVENNELRNLLEQLPEPLGISEPDDDRWDNQAELVKRYVNFCNNELDKDGSIEFEICLSSHAEHEIQYLHSRPKLLDDFRGEHDREYSYIKISQEKDGTIVANLIYEEIENEEIGYRDYELVNYENFNGTYKESISYKIFDLFRNRIYRFYAERLNVGSCSYNGISELNPDASNLAEVIHLLPSKNPSQFSRLNKYISTIFPNIEYISSVNKENSVIEITTEIIIWTTDASRENREDLALPLSACGTGLSQVIAILYVLITSVIPRTIIIDEPQSFLHPGAAKKLIEILKEFPQHQYFIATHSPMLITAAYPANIIKVTHDGIESKALVIIPF